ncbi:hypothetical protein M2139_002215 [Enterococcus sp. PF1-24]|uniref:hypothetical protein n=1 Tax=unclassified Enterococcus TaxID=2608891 RepID=UPI002475709E|nr:MULTISPECIES: hypothetical protein [unclassified Enterococcus]MDH6365213.1 hypothetical protein [Enterococcus sp. PFB1-1]MDH6402314.1 hypothetical protein [Enterococcus sp. PF1-24]
MTNLKVITLCGSTRFKDEFREIEAKLALVGAAVFSVGFFEKSEGIEITKEQEKLFKQLHFSKIDLSDEIFVIDVNGYIGESTRKEIDYAMQNNKVVRYYSKEYNG